MKSRVYFLCVLVSLLSVAEVGSQSQTHASIMKSLDGVWIGGDEMDKWGLTLARDGRAVFNPNFVIPFPYYSTWTLDGTNTIVVDLGGLDISSGNLLMATNKTERFVYDAPRDEIVWLSPRGKKFAGRTKAQSGSESLAKSMGQMRDALKNRRPDWRDPVFSAEIRDFKTPEELISHLKTCKAHTVSFTPQTKELKVMKFKLNFLEERNSFFVFISYLDAKYHFGEEKFRDKGVPLPKIEHIGIKGGFPAPYWTCDADFKKMIESIPESYPSRLNPSNKNLSVCSVESYCWVKDVERINRKILGELKEDRLAGVFRQLQPQLFSFPCRCRVETMTFKSHQ